MLRSNTFNTLDWQQVLDFKQYHCSNSDTIQVYMLRRFLILAVVALPFFATSQNSELNYRNQLKLSAFRPLNILNPGVVISYERFHNSKLSTQFSVGMAANMIGKPFHKLHGYNLGLEEKYFLSEKARAKIYLTGT
jgi:hypothetical protein